MILFTRRAAPVTLLSVPALCAALLAGCVTPARPVPQESFNAQSPATLAGTQPQPDQLTPSPNRRSPLNPLALNGEYTVTIYSPWSGPLSGHMTAEATRDGFKANTPPDVAWGMIGGVEGALGPILAPFLFPSGMLLTWTSSTPINATLDDGSTIRCPGTGSVGIGSLAMMRLQTTMEEPNGPVVIRIKDGTPVAAFTIAPRTPQDERSTDYTVLAARVRDRMFSDLFDRARSQSPEVAAYLKRLDTGAAKARDDFEFTFAAVLAARDNIKFTQPFIYRKPLPDQSSTAVGLALLSNKSVQAKFDDNFSIATIKVGAYVSAADVERAFDEVLAHTPPVRGLVLDVSNGPGIDLCSLLCASYLLDEPRTVGTFFGQNARDSALAGTLTASTISVSDAASIATLNSTLDRDGAATVRIEPRAGPRFTGPVALLTSSRTTSTSEPLVSVLRAANRVRQIGEPTSGRPLATREHDLGQGWVILLAAYDFLAAGAPPHSLTATRAIAPDERTTREGAPDAALRWLYSEINP